MPDTVWGSQSMIDQNSSTPKDGSATRLGEPRLRFQVHFINPSFVSCPLTDSVVLSNYVETSCQNIILGAVPQRDECLVC